MLGGTKSQKTNRSHNEICNNSMCSGMRIYALLSANRLDCKVYLWILLLMHNEMCALGKPTSKHKSSYAKIVHFYAHSQWNMQMDYIANE